MCGGISHILNTLAISAKAWGGRKIKQSMRPGLLNRVVRVGFGVELSEIEI